MFFVDFFWFFRLLRKLDLFYNYLKLIFNEIFDNLNKFEEFDLSGNIIRFSVCDFSGFEELLKFLKI